jgi:hypothetical protein
MMRRPLSIKMVTASCYHKGSYHEAKNTLNARCSVFVNACGKKVCLRRSGGRVFYRSGSGNPAMFRMRASCPHREYRNSHGFFGGRSLRPPLDTGPQASRMMVCTGIRSNADQRRRARALEPGASCRVRLMVIDRCRREVGPGPAGTGRERRWSIYVSFQGDKRGGDLLI